MAMVDMDRSEVSLWEVAEEWEDGEVVFKTLTDTYFDQNQEVQPNILISPQVVCVRYWVALGILSVAALSSDTLPKFFPGYFLAKGLLLLWTVYSKQPGT